MSVIIRLPKDVKKIDLNNLGELIWWSNHLGRSPEILWSVIEKIGNNAREVREYCQTHTLA